MAAICGVKRCGGGSQRDGVRRHSRLVKSSLCFLMAEHASGSVSQRAAAMAAFNQSVEKSNDPETAKQSNLTQREKAMAALNGKGVVSQRELRGQKGESQHAAAMKNLNIADQPPAKVIPNWKQTAAQKTASNVRKEIGGGASSARAMFQQQEAGAAPPKPTVAKPVKRFIPVASTSAPVKKWGVGAPSAAPPAAPSPRSVPSAPSAGAGAAGGGANNAAEAEQMVDHDLTLLVNGIKRLVAAGKGSTEAVSRANLCTVAPRGPSIHVAVLP